MMSQIDREGAFADLEEAIRLDPRDFRPYEFFSFLLLSQKMPEMALKAINDAIQNNPSARAFSDRAIVHVTLEHLDLAIADCNEAIRLDPNLAQAWSRRGMVRLPKQQYDAAIADLTEAIRLDPKDFSPYNARGCAWHIKREFDRALADFDNAIRIKPNTPSGHHNRGRAWLCKGQYDRAIEDFTECIRIDPQSSKTHRDRAVARMLQRRPEAIDGFQAVIELEGWNKKSTEAAVFGYIAARLVGNAPAAKRFLDSSAGNVNDAWPSPLLKFLRHQIDEPALLGLANEIGQQTEVHYCAGMEDLLANHLDQAKSHFRWVQVHEEREAIHYDIAVRELKRLESKP
jgi:tetratricopeptide (TPR) repeat protein